jgi:hypothetical protein
MSVSMMKSFFITFLFLILTYCSFSQVFKGEVILGGNVTQVDGDEVYGYRKVGFNGGLGVMFPFSFVKDKKEKPWALSMEMLFNQKGSRQKNYSGIDFCDTCPPEIECDPMMKYRLKMNYISIPFLLHYQDRDALMFAVGLSYNRLAGFNEIENGIEKQNVYTLYTIINPKQTKVEEMLKYRDALFAKDELSVIVDLRFRIWQQLKMNFRFEYSIFPIGIRRYYMSEGVEVDPYIRKEYHNLLSLRLIYMLNEPKVIIDKKPRVKREE